MSKRWIIGLGAALLAVLFGPASMGDAHAQQPIKIAFLSSLSGPFTPWGIQVRDGMKLAIAEINAAGGVGGRPMELLERDGLIKERKYTRIGVIVADYAWGHALRQSVEKHIKTMPGVQVQIEVAPVPERDFTTYLRKLQGLNPELLIATG